MILNCWTQQANLFGEKLCWTLMLTHILNIEQVFLNIGKVSEWLQILALTRCTSTLLTSVSIWVVLCYDWLACICPVCPCNSEQSAHVSIAAKRSIAVGHSLADTAQTQLTYWTLLLPWKKFISASFKTLNVFGEPQFMWTKSKLLLHTHWYFWCFKIANYFPKTAPVTI